MALNQSDKLERWKRFERARGWKDVYPTLPERIVNRALGHECRPAVFWSPWLVGTAGGLAAGLCVLLIGALAFGTAQPLVAAICAVMTGFFLGTSQFNRRNKCGVTTWEEFGDF